MRKVLMCCQLGIQFEKLPGYCLPSCLPASISPTPLHLWFFSCQKLLSCTRNFKVLWQDATIFYCFSYASLIFSNVYAMHSILFSEAYCFCMLEGLFKKRRKEKNIEKNRARISKRLRSPGIDSEESIRQAYVA